MIGEVLAVAAERLGEYAAGVLSRLGGTLGHASRTAHDELARLDVDARRRWRAEVAASARAPLPAGLRRVDASWLEAELAILPDRARTAVATASADPVDVWLARWATATLPPLDGRDRRDAATLLAWLAGIGADQMAFALGDAATTIPALAAAAVRIGTPPRVGQLGLERAAIERCRDISLDDELALVRIACRALAPHLAADPLASLELTRRLPRSIGLVIERELAIHARAALDQCPTLAACGLHDRAAWR